jgi:hypothetical protein
MSLLQKLREDHRELFQLYYKFESLSPKSIVAKGVFIYILICYKHNYEITLRKGDLQ